MRLAVYLGERPERDLEGVFDFYRRKVRNPARGQELVNTLGRAMLKLGERQIGRRGDGLLVNFRRTTVEKYITFYTINEQAGKLIVYHVRHGARDALATSTHRQYARKAERTAHPLHLPHNPTDN